MGKGIGWGGGSGSAIGVDTRTKPDFMVNAGLLVRNGEKNERITL